MVVLSDLDAKDVIQVAWVLAKTPVDAAEKARAAFEAGGFQPKENGKYHVHCLAVGQIPMPGEVVIAKTLPQQTIQIANR